MDARLIRAALIAASLSSMGAGFRTQNFLVTAPTPEFAKEVATAAEDYRRDLAIEWLGKELPPWREPCPITVHVGPQMGAGGATSFMFMENQPSGWTMTIQGSAERILDSVLPHEVTHTIFATHFGRPLPRWADEGACTTVEHASEREKQHRLLFEFLSTGRGIPFNQMFAMKEYPPDILPLYSQGYSLARFLIAQGGKRKFVNYVGDGMRWNNWTKATQSHYTFKNLSELQVTWLDWVRRGCPALAPREVIAANGAGDTQTGTLVAVNTASPSATAPPSTMLASRVHPSREETSNVTTGTSWYARVRDDAAARRIRGERESAPGNPLHDAVSEAVRPEQAIDAARVVTRPQAPEQAQQQVLQWSQPAP